MADAARKLVPDAALEHEHDNIVVLPDVSWQTYLRLLKARGERSVPRYAYDDGTLEIMSPSAAHEDIQSLIGDLVVAYCLDYGIEHRHRGSWTRRSGKLRKGAEPDDCFLFGDDIKSKIVPDLAIEVVWSSRALNKLPIYQSLGVREVWIWQGGELTAYVLRGKGYKAAKRSAVLPGIDLAMLSECIGEVSGNAAIKRFRAHYRARG